MATLTTSGKRKPAQVVVRATVRVHVEGTATRDEVIDAGLEALGEDRRSAFSYGISNGVPGSSQAHTYVDETVTVYADRD
jgi:hypothetical protein